MAYTGKKPVDFVDVTQSQSMTVSDDLTVGGEFTSSGIDDNATSTAVTIDSSGNVGVGLTNPSDYYAENLVVKTGQNGGVTIAAGDTTYSNYLMFADGTSGTDRYRGYLQYNHNSPEHFSLVSYGRMRFFTGDPATERMVIDSDGRLLHGDDFSPISSDVGIQSRKTSGDNFAYIASLSLGASEQAIVSALGYYNGLSYASTLATYRNSTNPPSSYLFLVNRNRTGYYHWVDTSGILRSSTASSNIGSTSGTVIGTQTSDERLKTIEANFEYGIDAVKQLVPIAYKFNNDDTEQRRLGFGAQTTQGIVPEAVYDSEECIDGYDDDPEDDMVKIPRSDDTKMMMDSVQLIPVLTKALQEAIAKIETLEEKVAALENA